MGRALLRSRGQHGSGVGGSHGQGAGHPRRSIGIFRRRGMEPRRGPHRCPGHGARCAGGPRSGPRPRSSKHGHLVLSAAAWSQAGRRQRARRHYSSSEYGTVERVREAATGKELARLEVTDAEVRERPAEPGRDAHRHCTKDNTARVWRGDGQAAGESRGSPTPRF